MFLTSALDRYDSFTLRLLYLRGNFLPLIRRHCGPSEVMKNILRCRK